MLSALDNKLKSLSSEKASTKLHLEEHERILKNNLQEVSEKEKNAKSGKRNFPQYTNQTTLEDRMDVDEPIVGENLKGRNRKFVT